MNIISLLFFIFPLFCFSNVISALPILGGRGGIRAGLVPGSSSSDSVVQNLRTSVSNLGGNLISSLRLLKLEYLEDGNDIDRQIYSLIHDMVDHVIEKKDNRLSSKILQVF